MVSAKGLLFLFILVIKWQNLKATWCLWMKRGIQLTGFIQPQLVSLNMTPPIAKGALHFSTGKYEIMHMHTDLMLPLHLLYVISMLSFIIVSVLQTKEHITSCMSMQLVTAMLVTVSYNVSLYKFGCKSSGGGRSIFYGGHCEYFRYT